MHYWLQLVHTFIHVSSCYCSMSNSTPIFIKSIWYTLLFKLRKLQNVCNNITSSVEILIREKSQFFFTISDQQVNHRKRNQWVWIFSCSPCFVNNGLLVWLLHHRKTISTRHKKSMPIFFLLIFIKNLSVSFFIFGCHPELL